MRLRRRRSIPPDPPAAEWDGIIAGAVARRRPPVAVSVDEVMESLGPLATDLAMSICRKIAGDPMGSFDSLYIDVSVSLTAEEVEFLLGLSE